MNGPVKYVCAECGRVIIAEGENWAGEPSCGACWLALQWEQARDTYQEQEGEDSE